MYRLVLVIGTTYKFAMKSCQSKKTQKKQGIQDHTVNKQGCWQHNGPTRNDLIIGQHNMTLM